MHLLNSLPTFVAARAQKTHQYTLNANDLRLVRLRTIYFRHLRVAIRRT
jgi:hypothetical protein